jgi:hypothetical protein
MFLYPRERLTGDSLDSFFEILEFLPFLSSGSLSIDVFSFSLSSLLLLSGFLLILKDISMCEFRTFRSRLYCTRGRTWYFSSLTLSVFFLSALLSRKFSFSGSAVTSRCFRYFFKATGELASRVSCSPSYESDPTELLALPILRMILLYGSAENLRSIYSLVFSSFPCLSMIKRMQSITLRFRVLVLSPISTLNT